jgi:hypothetical protein
MKRLSFGFILIALAAALSAQAQARDQAPGSDQRKDGDKDYARQIARPQAVLVTLVGNLTFVDDRPAIKTGDDTVLLEMPNFFKYAYFEGLKAGAAVKASGMLITPRAFSDKPQTDKGGQDVKAATEAPGNAPKALPVLIAKEVTIGEKTYIIVNEAREPDRAPQCVPREGAERPEAR